MTEISEADLLKVMEISKSIAKQADSNNVEINIKLDYEKVNSKWEKTTCTVKVQTEPWYKRFWGTFWGWFSNG